MNTGDTRDTSQVQKAVAFFTQAGLARLLVRLREKYVEHGRVGGQIVLVDSTPGERRNIASFLGKAPYRDSVLKIRLVDMDNALRQSGFACTLPELLSAFFPDQPLVTRAEKRAAHENYQNEFRAALQAIASALPMTSRGRSWLEHGQHGLEWLFARYKNTGREEQERQLTVIRYIAHLLDQLPGAGVPQRLALFAQKTSGDPHMLDPNRPAGRLLLLALNDLSNESSAPPQDRAQELRLYSDVGLLVDTISSYVAVFNLAGATYQDGTPDPWAQAAGERVVLLPLRQLLPWRDARPSRPDIYVVENPQVFEEIIAGLQDTNPRTDNPLPIDPRRDNPLWLSTLPTLICTAGWPSVAALSLLDMLLATSAEHRCYYSGDFDLKGLQIAAHLLARYPGRCHPWHIDAETYATALQIDGVAARANELEQLNALPAVFAPLVASMQEKKQWAYQEGIAHLLLASIHVYKDN